jgi:hypothetical protein
METYRENPIQKIWRLFSRIVLKDLLILTPADTARYSWAREVYSYQEIPEPFREELARLGIAEENFDYGVITPSFEGFLKPDTEKLVIRLAGERQIELLYAGERHAEVEELVNLMNHEFARSR